MQKTANRNESALLSSRIARGSKEFTMSKKSLPQKSLAFLTGAVLLTLFFVLFAVNSSTPALFAGEAAWKKFVFNWCMWICFALVLVNLVNGFRLLIQRREAGKDNLHLPRKSCKRKGRPSWAEKLRFSSDWC